MIICGLKATGYPRPWMILYPHPLYFVTDLGKFRYGWCNSQKVAIYSHDVRIRSVSMPCRWYDNIKMDFTRNGMRGGDMDWNDVAQGRNMCRNFVNAVMNIRLLSSELNFLCGGGNISGSRRTLLPGFSSSFRCCLVYILEDAFRLIERAQNSWRRSAVAVCVKRKRVTALSRVRQGSVWVWMSGYLES